MSWLYTTLQCLSKRCKYNAALTIVPSRTLRIKLWRGYDLTFDEIKTHYGFRGGKATFQTLRALKCQHLGRSNFKWLMFKSVIQMITWGFVNLKPVPQIYYTLNSINSSNHYDRKLKVKPRYYRNKHIILSLILGFRGRCQYYIF